MASETLTSADRFPPGTSVSAYPASNWPAHLRPPSGAPVGASAATAVVAAAGTLALTGLADATRYYAYALVSGEHRYVAFSTPVPAADGGAAAVEHEFTATDFEHTGTPGEAGYAGWTCYPGESPLHATRVGNMVSLYGVVEFTGPTDRAAYELAVAQIRTVMTAAVPAAFRPIAGGILIYGHSEVTGLTDDGPRTWSFFLSGDGGLLVAAMHDVDNTALAPWAGVLGEDADNPGGYAYITISASYLAGNAA